MTTTLYNGFRLIAFGVIIASILMFFAIPMFLNAGYCVDRCSYEFLDNLKALYATTIPLSIIALVALFFPIHILKKWLMFVLPTMVLITIYMVSQVSVYSSGIAVIDRTNMAKLGMYLLGVVTLIFLIGHLIYDWRKKRVSGK